MMKKILFPLLVSVVLVGCDKTDNMLRCGEYDVQITINQNDSITAVLNGDAVELQHAVSASGARYSGILNDTDVTLWAKGDDWTLYISDEEPAPCK